MSKNISKALKYSLILALAGFALLRLGLRALEQPNIDLSPDFKLKDCVYHWFGLKLSCQLEVYKHRIGPLEARLRVSPSKRGFYGTHDLAGRGRAQFSITSQPAGRIKFNHKIESLAVDDAIEFEKSQVRILGELKGSTEIILDPKKEWKFKKYNLTSDRLQLMPKGVAKIIELHETSITIDKDALELESPDLAKFKGLIECWNQHAIIMRLRWDPFALSCK